MKNTIKIMGIIALAAVIGFTMIGCNRGSSGAASAPAASATQTPAPAVSASGSATASNFLDEYERFVDEVVEVIRRMMSGDMTAMTQADALEARIAEMERRFQNLSEADLSPAQLQRYNELSQRLLNALNF